MEFVKPILAGGPIGILIWCGILLIGPVGLVLSVASIIQSRRAKLHKYPLAFKFLITQVVAGLFIGCAGIIHGATLVSLSVGKRGAERAEALMYPLGALSLSAMVSSLLILILVVLTGITVITFHQRQKYLAEDENSRKWIIT